VLALLGLCDSGARRSGLWRVTKLCAVEDARDLERVPVRETMVGDLFVDCVCGGRTVRHGGFWEISATKQEMERRLHALSARVDSDASLEETEALDGADAAELHGMLCPCATDVDLVAAQVVRLLRSVCRLRQVLLERCDAHEWQRTIVPESVVVGESFDICLQCSDLCSVVDDEIAFLRSAAASGERTGVTELAKELRCICRVGCPLPGGVAVDVRPGYAGTCVHVGPCLTCEFNSRNSEYWKLKPVLEAAKEMLC
jgi:hypothetical protein